MNVLAHLVSPEASFFGLHMAAFLVFLQMALCLYAGTPGVSFSPKDTSSVGLGPSLITSFNINYPFKDPISNRVPWCLEHQHMNFQGTQISSGSMTYRR